MAEAQEQEQPKKKGGKLKLIIFSVVLVAAVGGGGFMLGGKGAASATEPDAETSEDAEHAGEDEHAEEAEEPAVEGEVVLIDPVTLSLADGHYLKVGLALQLAPPDEEEAAAAEGGGHGGGSAEDEPAMSAEETARAVDHAISLFGAHGMDDLKSPKQRKHIKTELVEALKEAYHGEIVDVYFTAFAMQ
jgi:flagellar FliL protein